MTSKSILTECSENALAEIQRIESQIVALHYACRDIRKDYSYENEAIKDFSALHGSLYINDDKKAPCFSLGMNYRQ